MFYSETLLSKTGPLARVWLSANIERKISKNHVLQTNVKDSVDAIVTPDQAPLALRLSGQLLLGVVRIYRRKANYLLDDCNEALIKIKMAFRTSGNNDLAEGLHMPSRDALMLPDVLTEGDDLGMPPLPDAAFLLSHMEDDPNLRKKRAGSRDINLHDEFSASQFIQTSTENDNEILEPIDELDLGLDLGFDLDVTSKDDISLQVGRDAPEPREVEEDLLSKADTPVPSKEIFGLNEGESTLNIFKSDSAQIPYNDDIQMPYNDDIQMPDDDGDINMIAPDHQNLGLSHIPIVCPERISESPLSDIDEMITAEAQAQAQAEAEHNLNTVESPINVPQIAEEEQEEENQQPVIHRPALRARRQRQLQPDPVTELSSAQIKSQQSNTDKITRPQSFLPRDSGLLALTQMQKTGAFVSQIIGGSRGDTWAPEIRGILSLDTIRTLKRKRENDYITDVDSSDQPVSPSKLRLDLGGEEEHIMESDNANLLGSGIEANDTPALHDPSTIDLAVIDDEEATSEFREDHDDIHYDLEEAKSPAPESDETVNTLVDPASSVAITTSNQHAVHVLRNHFDSKTSDNSEQDINQSVLLEELRPEASVSRSDATKFFFEILVLGTKDAIIVEQQETVLGGPIVIRPKQNLWSAWAEREAGKALEEQEIEKTHS